MITNQPPEIEIAMFQSVSERQCAEWRTIAAKSRQKFHSLPKLFDW